MLRIWTILLLSFRLFAASANENEEDVEFLSCEDCEYFSFPNEVSINYEADEAKDESDQDEVVDDHRQLQMGQSQCFETELIDKQLKAIKSQDKIPSIELEQAEAQVKEQLVDFLDSDFTLSEMNTYGFFKDLTSDSLLYEE